MFCESIPIIALKSPTSKCSLCSHISPPYHCHRTANRDWSSFNHTSHQPVDTSGLSGLSAPITAPALCSQMISRLVEMGFCDLDRIRELYRECGDDCNLIASLLLDAEL